MSSIDAQQAKYAKLFAKGADKVKGRWRGGHILGTSEIRYADWPTTEEVIERGTCAAPTSARPQSAISSPSATTDGDEIADCGLADVGAAQVPRSITSSVVGQSA